MEAWRTVIPNCLHFYIDGFSEFCAGVYMRQTSGVVPGENAKIWHSVADLTFLLSSSHNIIEYSICL